MKLIIIEGAGKKETIEKYLGKDYRVFATKGHIRDLPSKSLAVNVKKNFEPKYTIMEDKKEIVKDLIARAQRADEIFLATDPDREGEAISWHIANILDIDPKKKVRIVFNEITKRAITEALDNPREIDTDLVDAQQARRILDRLVGYKVSPILCKKIQNKLSAGRVQSVALRLIVDREREILNFVPEEYWNIFASLKKQGKSAEFTAQLVLFKGRKLVIANEEQARAIEDAVKNSPFIVDKIKKSVSKSHAPAPFITSTLQQDALNKLGMSLKQTTATAQQLYEGVELAGEGKVALITYIRTDSTRVSKEAQAEALDFIREKFGERYAPEKPNFYASKKNAQDAHEAIRPITLMRSPESLKNVLQKNAYRLYKLIYDRFLASQMSEAIYDALSVDILSSGYTFRLNGKTLVFEGFTAAYSAYEEKDESENDNNKKLPELSEGEALDLAKLDLQQKFTKPPSRYTEAALVKVMEEKGIGRPATYTPTITTLANRVYTQKDGRYLVPTELGFTVTDMLIKYFPDIMDVGFTAQMEDKLDEIGEGGKIWQSVIADFYEDFKVKLSEAQGDSFTLKKPDIPTEIPCSKCGTLMVIKNGRFGEFLACPAFPKCKNIQNLDKKNEDGESEDYGVCQKCGAKMVLKQGRYGKFTACSNYPDCKYTIKIDESNEDLGNCPDCNKPLRRVRSKKGLSFISCSGYPDCTFITYYPVASEKCEECGSYLNIKKTAQKHYMQCSNKSCKYKKDIVENEE